MSELALAPAPARRPKRTMPVQKPGLSEQDQGTPRELIRAVEHRFGPISWDLAAHEGNAVCDLWIGEEQNSLSVPWAELSGSLFWLNPPYDNIEPWARKCKIESKRGARILLLTPASIGAHWFWDYVHPKRDALVLALSPRLIFQGETQPYPKDCILSLYGFGVVGFRRYIWTRDLERGVA